MKLQSAIRQDDAYINIVVTTGCPHSGWEAALPALQQLGLEKIGCAFTKWQDDLFQKANITDLLQLNQPLQPDHSQTEKAMALLSDEPGAPLLWADSRSLWLLDFWATTFPQARFLLLYTRAVSALAYALRQGEDPEQFMKAWHTANRRLMHFQHRNRRRSLLLDAEAADQHPEALANACQRIGLVLRQENPSPTLTTTALALERLLAGQFLREQSVIQTMQMELEASTQPLGETTLHESPQPIEAYRGYQQWQTRIEQLTTRRDEQAKLASDRQTKLTQARQAQEKLETASKETEQENELLLLQLHQVQEELEAVFLQKQQIEQAQKKQDTKLKQLQQEMDETRIQFQAEEKVREGLAGEQHKLQTQIEQLTKARDEQTKLAVERHQSQIQQLTTARGEQAKLASDRQAKLTQARQAQEKLETANKDTEQENELLTLQLHQAQEELEAVFLQKQQIDQVRKEQDTKFKQLQQELDETRRQFQAEEKTRKGLAGEQHKLQTQIKQLTRARDKQAKLAVERQSQIQQLTTERDEQAKLASDRETKLTQTRQTQEKLETANKETEQENELLLLQLHQVQEELERYFLKYQKLTQETEKELQAVSSDSEEHKEIENSSPAKPRKITAPIHALTKLFRHTHKAQKREKKQIHLLKGSDLFDEAWYLAEYPDVAEAGIDPVEHYLRYGATEERNPSQKFDTAFYLATNPDIAVAEINPLIHYILFGREEGRPPSSQGATT